MVLGFFTFLIFDYWHNKCDQYNNNMNYIFNLINISGTAKAIFVFYKRKWANRVQHNIPLEQNFHSRLSQLICDYIIFTDNIDILYA